MLEIKQCTVFVKENIHFQIVPHEKYGLAIGTSMYGNFACIFSDK